MTQTARRGDWVKIHFTILSPQDRAGGIPQETKEVPLEAYMNGFLEEDQADLGQQVQVRTLAQRSLSGKLIAVFPEYTHTFGRPIPQLLEIGPSIRQWISEGQS